MTCGPKPESLALDREPGDVQFDEESGEGGTVPWIASATSPCRPRLSPTIDEIDFAVIAIDKKLYGACENCGQPIRRPGCGPCPMPVCSVACKSGGPHRR